MMVLQEENMTETWGKYTGFYQPPSLFYLIYRYKVQTSIVIIGLC